MKRMPECQIAGSLMEPEEAARPKQEQRGCGRLRHALAKPKVSVRVGHATVECRSPGVTIAVVRGDRETVGVPRLNNRLKVVRCTGGYGHKGLEEEVRESPDGVSEAVRH